MTLHVCSQFCHVTVLILVLTLTFERVQLKHIQLRSPFCKADITASHLRHPLTMKLKDFRHRLVSGGVAHPMARILLWKAMMHKIGVNLRSIGTR